MEMRPSNDPPPRQEAYPGFVGADPEARRRWDLAVAIAEAWFPEEGGPQGRWYRALVLYKSRYPTT
jgi:hypothetical protein